MLTIENDDSETFQFKVTLNDETRVLDHFQTVSFVMEYVKGKLRSNIEDEDS